MPGAGGVTGGSGGGSGFNYGGLFSAAGDLLGGLSNFLGGSSRESGFQAQAGGYFQEAQFYDQEKLAYLKAAGLEEQNIKWAGASGEIQSIQAKRKIYQSESGTKSDVANAGLAESGNALDILRSSAEQGGLTLGMIGEQTAITQNNYQVQKNAYEMQADQAQNQENMARMEGFGAQSAASAAGTGGVLGAIGGVLQAGATIAPFFL